MTSNSDECKQIIEVFGAGVYKYTYLIVTSPFLPLPFSFKRTLREEELWEREKRHILFLCFPCLTSPSQLPLTTHSPSLPTPARLPLKALIRPLQTWSWVTLCSTKGRILLPATAGRNWILPKSYSRLEPEEDLVLHAPNLHSTLETFPLGS